MDKVVAQELGERVTDLLRGKHVQMCVQKKLQILGGSTAPSKTTVVNNVRSRGWTDLARIVDSTIARWKKAPVSLFQAPEQAPEDRGATLRLRTQAPHSHSRGYNMFVCKFTCAIVNMQKVAEFVASQHWPFLQICEKINFDNGATD